ncbi:Endo/exonuclease/phosphatase domain-containing protein, partial [Aphis craccivora]
LAIGKINIKNKNKTIPWWNKECNTAIKADKKIFKQIQKTKSIDNHIALKKFRAQAKFITKKIKTESWQKYTNSINSNTSSTEMWNKIKSIK